VKASGREDRCYRSGCHTRLTTPNHEHLASLEILVRRGNILPSIHTEAGEEVTRVKDIFKFKRAGAGDVAYTGESKP
jgi:hypothetical protein